MLNHDSIVKGVASDPKFDAYILVIDAADPHLQDSDKNQIKAVEEAGITRGVVYLNRKSHPGGPPPFAATNRVESDFESFAAKSKIHKIYDGSLEEEELTHYSGDGVAHLFEGLYSL